MKYNIKAAIDAHQAWAGRFREAIEHMAVAESVRQASYDDMCEFGKWLYGLDDEVKRHPSYRRVKDLHYRFHAEAAEIVGLIDRAQTESARIRLAGGFSASSAQLIAALHAWLDDTAA